eukprot:3682080-Prymnesium_polylepis.1
MAPESHESAPPLRKIFCTGSMAPITSAPRQQYSVWSTPMSQFNTRQTHEVDVVLEVFFFADMVVTTMFTTVAKTNKMIVR